jgi:hypothetical protein
MRTRNALILLRHKLVIALLWCAHKLEPEFITSIMKGGNNVLYNPLDHPVGDDELSNPNSL